MDANPEKRLTRIRRILLTMSLLVLASIVVFVIAMEPRRRAIQTIIKHGGSVAFQNGGFISGGKDDDPPTILHLTVPASVWARVCHCYDVSDVLIADHAGPCLDEFKALPELEGLVVLVADATDTDIRNLPVMPNVRFADFSMNDLTDNGVETICAKLPNVEELILTENPICGSSLRSVSRLKRLESLALTYCRELTDQHAKVLAESDSLTSLGLAGCSKLDGSCVAVLLENPQLLELFVSESHVSRNDVNREDPRLQY